MTEIKPHRVVSLTIEIDEKSANTISSRDSETDGGDEKLGSVEKFALSIFSIEETKVNFGFLPIPKNCRVGATKPFKFNLAINILFGLASTFTVHPFRSDL
jgi:hypothetical protein